MNVCVQEFSLKQLSLTHEDPPIFIICQWQKGREVNKFYLIYRWTMALIFISSCLASIFVVKDPIPLYLYVAKWFIYLTHWGYLLCTVQATLSAIMLTAAAIEGTVQTSALKLYKLYWLTYNVSVPVAVVITTLYWWLIPFDPELVQSVVLNYFVHICNSVLMLIDLCMVRHPVRILHFYQVAVAAIAYSFFNAFYCMAGGTNEFGRRYIYSVIVWEEPIKPALICLTGVVMSVGMHLVVWGLYRLRLTVHSKIIKDDMVNKDIPLNIVTEAGLLKQ